jgi:hypothetical protein
MGKSQWQVAISDGSATPHGVWIEEPFAYLTVELKDGLGLGGEPFPQGLATYGKILAQEKVPSPP